MNCIPSSGIAAGETGASRYKTGAACLLLLATIAAVAPIPAAADARAYGLEYEVRPDPAAGVLEVSLHLQQDTALLREMSFRSDARIAGVSGDGEIDHEDGTWRWRPPAGGGSLTWRVEVTHVRGNGGYDAWLGPEWGLFRAEDIIPRAASRTLRDAHSETWISFRLPRRWSVVTQYYGKNDRFRVHNPARRFDQPSGWIVMGQLGVRREIVAGTHVAVAGPAEQSVRRMDILALLTWTLPQLDRLLPALPDRLTVVSAGDPMWRGGLSAPQSLFIHADRPLISENATSTLLHEVMHLALGLTAEDGLDWVLEGLAEYYSLELLHRSGTISDARYGRARADVAAWSKDAGMLCRPVSAGPTTALAVTLFGKLDREIRVKSSKAASLDDVTRALWQAGGRVELDTLIETAESIAGARLDTLDIANLPGCAKLGRSRQTD
jgi:hypothetical protein